MDELRPTYEELCSRLPEVIERFRELYADLDPERKSFPRLFRMKDGLLHGLHHWVRVGVYALAIAAALRKQDRVRTKWLKPAGALERAVLLAAFFHDCARSGEGPEDAHGRRGEEVWRHYAERKGLDHELREVVSQALLFHVGHPSVDPAANEVTICLCNADRLDRVRLGHRPLAELMYDDGVWPSLDLHSQRLLAEVRQEEVKERIVSRR